MQSTRSTTQRIWEYALGSRLLSFGGALRVMFMWPLALVYRVGLAFSRLLTPPGARLVAPLVSVGSLTTGGSGKTPFVAALIRRLLERDIKVGVVGSGYGRTRPRDFVVVGGEAFGLGSSVVGDEIAELSAEFPNVWFSVAASKRSAALSLANSGAVELILVDDGFQSRGLYRDLDIVLMNCESRSADFRLLPAGRLREPRSALSRADVIVFTKLGAVEAGPPDWLAKIARKHGKSGPDERTFTCRNRYTFRRVNPSGNLDGIERPPSGLGFVVSALADNHSFHRAALGLGVEIGGTIEFDDHFPYDAACAAELSREYSQRSCSYLLTSAKDWAKLKEFEWDVPVWVMSALAETNNESELIDLIVEILSRRNQEHERS